MTNEIRCKMTYEQAMEIITNAVQKDGTRMTAEQDIALAIIQKAIKNVIETTSVETKNDMISIKDIEKIFEEEMNEIDNFLAKIAYKSGREVMGMLYRKSAFTSFLFKIYDKMESEK